MLDRSRTRFHDKNCKKVAQHFHCAVSKVLDRVKSVALWSANIRKLEKDHKGYGSAASLREARTVILNSQSPGVSAIVRKL
jgi:hypothetical protein